MPITETEIASLSDAEAQAFANFCIRRYHSRRYEAGVLAAVTNAPHYPRGFGHDNIERIRDFVREVVRQEITKIEETH